MNPIFRACGMVSVVLSLQGAAMAQEEGSNPCPIEDADLWVLAGQSNMVGAELVKDPRPEAPDPRIVMLNLDGRWMTAQEPIHRYFEATAPAFIDFMLGQMTPEQQEEFLRNIDAARKQSQEKPIGGYGLGLPFAQHILEHTGRPIGLIPCAQGATSMANWDPARKDEGDKSHYGFMLQRIRSAGRPIKGVLWYQGEAEWSLTDGYPQKLLDLVDALRRDTGQPDLPFLYVQIGRLVTPDHTPAEGWEKVRDLQRTTARLRENMYVVPATDLPMTDHIHVSGEGLRRLGIRLAETALTHIYGVEGHATPIDLESIEAFNNDNNQATIRVRFSGVTGRLTAPGLPAQFEIRGATPAPIPTVVFRVDFVPDDPAALDLRIATPLREKVQLICGPGLDPYMNIVDERDMAIPCFGPVDVEPPAAAE